MSSGAEISTLRHVARLRSAVVVQGHGCVEAANALQRVSYSGREVALYNCGIFGKEPRASTERGQASSHRDLHGHQQEDNDYAPISAHGLELPPGIIVGVS